MCGGTRTIHFFCGSSESIRPGLSYGLILGAAFWAFTQTYADNCNDIWTCSNIGFALVALEGMLGFWRYGRKHTRKPSFYKPVRLLSTLFLLPLICIDLYLYNDFDFKIAYCHLIYPIINIGVHLQRRKENKRLVDLSHFISLSSMSFASIISKNYYGLLAAFVFAVHSFVLAKRGKLFGLGLKHLRNLLLSIFLVLILNALVQAEWVWMQNQMIKTMDSAPPSCLAKWR